MASSISIPPRGSRSSSPRPPPHYKFTILPPDVYAPKTISYVPGEDKSYGFCRFLMGKFESHFGMRCTMPTVPSAAFFGDFNEFEERFLVDAEYIVIVITSMSLKVFKRFYPRLLVFVTVRPEWVNRFIFVMVGDITLEPSVDLTVFFHEPIFFKESGWEADIETWKNLHVLLKERTAFEVPVEWCPIKEKSGSPRCDVVSIIQRTVVETEVQEVRTRRRTDSRRSEGSSTPGNLSPPRPARPLSSTSTPSSPTPARLGSHLSKSTDSQLHVVSPAREKARTAFNEAGEAVTSSARPSEEKRRSPFLGRRSFGGRAKILVEQDLPKPKVKIERAPQVQMEEEQRRKRRSTGGDDHVFVEISSKLESTPERKRASPERRKKNPELLVGTENLETEVCIVENIPIDGSEGGGPQRKMEKGKEREEKMEEGKEREEKMEERREREEKMEEGKEREEKMEEGKEREEKMEEDEKLAGAKRSAEEKTKEEGKRRKPNEKKTKEAKGASLEEERVNLPEEKRKKEKEKKASSEEERKKGKEKRTSSEEKKEEKIARYDEEKRKAPTQEEKTGLASDEKNAKWGEDVEGDPRKQHSDPEDLRNKGGKTKAKQVGRSEEKERSKEMADKEKLIAMETGESQTFLAMSSKAGTPKDAGAAASQWDYSLTSDYSSLNSSASSSRTLSSVQSPPPPLDSIVRSINIEEQGSVAPNQPCATDVAKKSAITDRAARPEKGGASGPKEDNSEVAPKMTERPEMRRSSKGEEQMSRAVLHQETDLAAAWRGVVRDFTADPLHRPVPVFLLLVAATALSPHYHSLSSAAFAWLAALLGPAAAATPATVAILPAAALAALPEPPTPAAPGPVLRFTTLLSPFLMGAGPAGLVPQKLYFFRVARGP